MVTTQDPRVKTIGETFVALLKMDLTREQFREMQRRNATPDYADRGCCASHDFCDANMVMAEAFKQHGLDPLAGTDEAGPSDEMTTLWNAAWTWATPMLNGSTATGDIRNRGARR